MADEAAPKVLVFDVNETLLDITVLEPLFARIFGEARAMREWFAQLVLYSEALTLAGLYIPFGSLGAGALRMLGQVRGVVVTDGEVAELRALMRSMPAHPEVAEALATLRDAGFRLVTLTNSAPDPERSPLERAGLAGYFEQMFTVDAVRRFKPAPECYGQVARALEVGFPDLCLVAAHMWDTLGAQALGCRGALVARPGNAVLPVEGVPQPDIVAADLAVLAKAIVLRWC
ncbi:MAG: haloacid dehalogenase type II [Proteobacteria bacterium]|nr:haloacid dehalogenase type II [Pseudomonadota bacterium]